jgi:hypothetical protein
MSDAHVGILLIVRKCMVQTAKFILSCFQNYPGFRFIFIFFVRKEIFIVLTRQAPSYWNERSCRGLQQQLAGLAWVILHIHLFKQ